MSSEEIFDSAMRSSEDFGGVFEYNYEDGGYFYLYDASQPEGKKVLAAIHVASPGVSLNERVVLIRWDDVERTVGLWIHDELWAAFDVDSKTGYGGKYRLGGTPVIPSEIARRFK